MADTYTPNLDLTLMARGDRNWDATLNAILTTLDAQQALGALAVRPAEDGPSASLSVKISAGTFRKGDGTAVAVAAVPALALAASSTSSVYLSDAGVATVSTSGFPAGTAIVPLAIVTTGTGTITGITDARRTLASFGAAVDYLASDGDGSGLTGITQSQVAGLTTDLAARAVGPPILDPALRAWRAALATVAAGSGTAEIALLGDSISEGFSAANIQTESFIALLRARLQAAYGGSGVGLCPFYRDSGEASGLPPFWSYTGTWTNQNATGPYSCARYAQGAGTYAEITVTGDTADIFHVRNSGGVADTDPDAATWSVDGGAATKFNTLAASNTETKLTIPLGSYGSHTVRITSPASHTLILWGIATRTSTGVFAHNLGKTGAVANDLLVGFSGLNQGDIAGWLGALAPHLTIIAYGSNDYYFQVSIADYKAHVTSMIEGAQAAGSSVLLLATNPRGDLASPAIPQSDYWQALSDLADTYGCAYLSMGSRWKDVATQTALDLAVADTVHPNSAGHSDYASALADALGFSGETNVVHTTGDESIDGIKTFVNPLTKFGSQAGGARLASAGLVDAGIWLRYTDGNMYIDAEQEIVLRANLNSGSPVTAVTIGTDGSATFGAAIRPPALADAAAPDGSVFFGSDHLDGSSNPKFCRKQGGTVTVIG